MRKEQTAVDADAVRAELMAVAGVASAEVDVGKTGGPDGVRVRLTPDADARRVGAEVQRVLAAHGMRSRFSDPPGDASEVPIATEQSRSEEPDEAAPVSPLPPPTPPPTSPPEQPPPPVASVVPMAAVPAAPDESPSGRVITGGLRSVAVEERADGLGVIVTLADGRRGSHRLTGEEADELDAAVITATGAAVGVEAETVATEWMDIAGGSVVTVVMRLVDGTLVAGAGVVRVGRAYAVGFAARAALDL